MISIFWLILSLLVSIFRPSCSKMASRWPNIAPSCSKTARLKLPIPQKNNKNIKFFDVFGYLACLPKWLQNAPQINPEAAKLLPKWPSWRSCWPILALLAAIFAPSSSNLSSKRPQDGAWEVFYSIFLEAFCKYRGRPPKLQR